MLRIDFSMSVNQAMVGEAGTTLPLDNYQLNIPTYLKNIIKKITRRKR